MSTRERIKRYLVNGIFSIDEIAEITKAPKKMVQDINWELKNADRMRALKRDHMRGKRARNVG